MPLESQRLFTLSASNSGGRAAGAIPVAHLEIQGLLVVSWDPSLFLSLKTPV
ncbi:hypothetical protein AB5N19_06607 [Seiridium cardinale]|uniref:Uncharacterized protein n=1 Tax=Seiridium cardinale TaxID=138064 RepID=A0ABR2XZH5_9PEZI